MRFPIQRSTWAVPLLALFGGTADRSYLELTDDSLVARFGWLFHHAFPIPDIESVGRRSWPLLCGIGWRANLVGTIGLIGSLGNVVEIRLKRRRWLWMALPLPCSRLAVSLEDPDAFLYELAKTGVTIR